MRWSLALAVLALWIAGGSGMLSPYGWCPCKTWDLCKRIPADHQHQVEVFVFDNGGTDYQHYDWSKITTAVVKSNVHSGFVCAAHANKVRVIMKGKLAFHYLTNGDRRTEWIIHMEHIISSMHLDGIYLEEWNRTEIRTVEYEAISKFVDETAQFFHRRIPGSLVTMNVPWSPNCTYGQCYDFVSIAKSCDFLFVMPSDFDRQKWDYCFAKANAPYDQTYTGLSAYIKLGVDSRKLITGISWLGLDYPCMQLFEPGRCKLREYHFRGSRCSSFVATWIPYKQIMELLLRSITGRYWDDNYKSPYFVYKVNNIFHEVWYDDPESISLRSTIVRKLNLGGVGAWLGNSLNYSVNPIAAMQTEEMWNALSPMRRKWGI
ncbi:di-N-acetylchitobiase-like [Mustelus asterias]